MTVHIPDIIIWMVVFMVIIGPVGLVISRHTGVPTWWLVVFAVVWSLASDIADRVVS